MGCLDEAGEEAEEEEGDGAPRLGGPSPPLECGVGCLAASFLSPAGVFRAGSVSPKPRWRLRFRRAAPPISHPLPLRGVGLFRRPCFFVVLGNLFFFFFSLTPELQKMPLASLIDPFSPSLTWGGAGRRTDYLFGLYLAEVAAVATATALNLALRKVLIAA